MAKLLLHIGFPKTGTTSLQSCFSRSRDQLRSLGVCYPPTISGDQHAMLIPYLFGHQATPHWLVRRHGNQENLLENAKRAWSLVTDSIERDRPHTIIISSEHFFDLGVVPSFDQGLKKLCRLAETVEVIAYVRSPSSEYKSYAQEQLKSRSVPVTPDRIETIRRRLEPFLASPSVKVRVHAFDRDELIGADVIDDFAARYLPPDAEFLLNREEVDLNQTISAEAMALLECILHDTLPDYRIPLESLDFRRVKALGELDRDTEGYATPTYHAGVARAIHDAARELDWLETSFGISFPRPEPDSGNHCYILPELSRVRDYCIVDEERFELLCERFAQL